MSDADSYDAIVIGVGGMGSAAAAHLAERGADVLGLERYDVPHSMGSSHGVTRIIRLAYYEHPSYVPLLRRAYELWRDLEADYDRQLLHVTGSVDAAPPDDPLFEGSKRSCEDHDIPHEVLSSAELGERFPGYDLPEDHMAVYQPDGGFLWPEQCIVAHVQRAHANGAEIRARERVQSWESTGGTGADDPDDGVVVETDRGTYEASKLVIAAGAWAAEQVDALEGIAVPERQALGWFQPTAPEHFSPENFPVFNLQVSEGRYYGFPTFHVPGFKIGRYHHLDETVDPDEMDREPNREDEAILRECTERYFPAAAGPTQRLATCMFTNTPDEHFVIDRLPDHPQVSVAAGFSGHGFKFASVVGEILADLTLAGGTDHDVGMFSIDRFD
ncbi:N-methyl-L-tryptophan oxidase [Natronoarchaeum mannanilyticum]|uniref:N-methyl-L-tryptophan oxidase n=1 Tax=Natronoarchaeum mannanilyticum TaxID=926360 RepID=UPI0036165088